MLKNVILTISCWLTTISFSSGQSITLDTCHAMAKQNYPLIKQYKLIEKSKDYSISNAQKGYLPQLIIAGQATYQSAVTQVPISLPNSEIPALSKDQYKVYGEVSQSLTDLFTLKHQKEFINTNSEIETQKTDVEFYKLKERINNLYFGILLIDAQIQQTELLKKDIQKGIDQANVAIANGVALKSNADNLKAELIKADQRVIEQKATREGYSDMLALFINKPIDVNTVLEKPRMLIITDSINRPELKLFDLQKKSFDIQRKIITDRNMPRFSLFFQGGLGKPALNMLSPDFESYYIYGLRLSWNISGFYTYRNEKQLLTNSQRMTDTQKEIFLFNTKLTVKQQNADISKMQNLIETDNSIITLRESVKNSTRNQLMYGTATTNDYLIAVNAEDQAKQNKIIHEIQLLMTEYNKKLTMDN